MIVSDNLIDAINDEAFKELEEAEVIIEEIKVPIIDNEDTIKKIDDSMRFVTAEAQAKSSFGLRSSTRDQVSQTKPSSTYESTRSSYNSSYSSNYNSSYNSSGYRYGQKEETFETKVSRAIDRIEKSARDAVDKESASKTLRSNWNVLELMDDEKIRKTNNKKKAKRLTKGQAEAKAFFYRSCEMAVMTAMELAFSICFNFKSGRENK